MVHHCVASSLILFSMMCNEIAAGVITLIVHDFSNTFIAVTRVYVEAHFKKNRFVTAFIFISLLLIWIYMRLIVYPFCLLASVYINKPLPTDEWYIIKYEYLYLSIIGTLLVAMHIYWTYYIILSAYSSVKNQQPVNKHDV